MFNCPQCSEETETLNEGYCEYCRQDNQNSLDLHNLAYGHWQSLSNEERETKIKEALK